MTEYSQRGLQLIPASGQKTANLATAYLPLEMAQSLLASEEGKSFQQALLSCTTKAEYNEAIQRANKLLQGAADPRLLPQALILHTMAIKARADEQLSATAFDRLESELYALSYLDFMLIGKKQDPMEVTLVDMQFDMAMPTPQQDASGSGFPLRLCRDKTVNSHAIWDYCLTQLQGYFRQKAWLMIGKQNSKEGGLYGIRHGHVRALRSIILQKMPAPLRKQVRLLEMHYQPATDAHMRISVIAGPLSPRAVLDFYEAAYGRPPQPKSAHVSTHPRPR